MNNKKSSQIKKHIPSEFKKDVLAYLKHLGLMFPTTEEEVKNFEKLYGITHIEMPDELSDSDSILNWCKQKIGETSHPVYSLAARKAENGLSNETLQKMKELHELAAKKSKKKRKS